MTRDELRKLSMALSDQFQDNLTELDHACNESPILTSLETSALNKLHANLTNAKAWANILAEYLPY